MVDSLTVTSMGGFSSPVTITLDSVRPAEPTISVSFNPNPVIPPPNGTIQTGMRIATQPGTPRGNYVVYFHGAGDTITRRSSVEIKIVGPTFYLHYAPECSTGQGFTVIDTVSVVSRYGFNSPVTLVLADWPPSNWTKKGL